MKRSHRMLLLACCVAGAAAMLGAAQDAILVVAMEGDEVEIPQGDAAIAVLRIDNPSVYPADDIEATFEIDGIVVDVEPEGIEELRPFETASVVFTLSADETLPLGRLPTSVEVLYTYCIGDLCYQIADEAPFTLNVLPPSAQPVQPAPVDTATRVPSRRPLRGAMLAVGVVFLVGTIVLRRRYAMSWPLYVALGLIALSGLAYGVALRQHDQAQGIAAVLCTSCVGIEATQRAEPAWSAPGMAALGRVEQGVSLLVFYATWCHACPYAEEMVELAAEHNPRITYRFVDVEEEPDLAERSGVVRSGRTVVPAILRVETDEVLFGAEDLERRLIRLLERKP